MESSQQTPHVPQEEIEQPDNIEDYTIKVLNGLFECQIHSALSKVVNPLQAWKCSVCKRFSYDLVCCIGQFCQNYYCRQCIDQQVPPPCHPLLMKGPYYRELAKQELSQIDNTLLSGCTVLGCPNQRKEMSLFQLKNHLGTESQMAKQMKELLIAKNEAELQDFKAKYIQESEHLLNIKDTQINELTLKVKNQQVQIEELGKRSERSQVKGSRVKTDTLQREIQLRDSFISLQFIVTKNDTVYAGDGGHYCLIVIGKQSSKPTLIPLNQASFCGVITRGESILAIGCGDGCLLMLSLKDELNPVITATIQLSSDILSICKMSESHLLCGQYGGYLHVVDDNQQVVQFQAPIKKRIMDIVKTCNKYACATSRGILIVKATKFTIKLVSTHRPSDKINCICYVKDKIVLLGVNDKKVIDVFDYRNNTTLKSITNPSGDYWPHRILKLSHRSFILQDDRAISIINIESEPAVIYQNSHGWKGIQRKIVDSNNLTLYTNENIKDKRQLKELRVTFE